MAKFFYSVKFNNKIEQGYINASTMEDAANQLEYKGYIVLEISEVFTSKNTDLSHEVVPLTTKEKKEFFNSFYIQYKSGRPALQVFQTIASSTTSENVKMLALHICHKITRGLSFGDALRQYSESIGYLYCSVIYIGDKSGKLEEVLAGVIKNLSKLEKIQQNIIKKATYPTFVFLLLIGAFIFFNSFVFKVMQAGFSGESISTSVCLTAAITQIAITYIILFLIFQNLKKNKKTVSNIIDMLCKIKACKIMFNDFYYFNFFYLLSLCTVSGVSPKEAILMCGSILRDINIARKIDKAADRIGEGCNISTALVSTGLFSDYANSQIPAGEKSGQLEKAFEYIAIDYENKFNTQMGVVLKLVEPIMIIIAAIGLLILGKSFYSTYFGVLLKF